MPTTTIRLPKELKSRVAAVADRAGTSTHSFIIQAIAEKTTMEELSNDFHKLADQRYSEFLETGQVLSWEEMRTYLESRMAGKARAVRPAAKKLAR